MAHVAWLVLGCVGLAAILHEAFLWRAQNRMLSDLERQMDEAEAELWKIAMELIPENGGRPS